MAKVNLVLNRRITFWVVVGCLALVVAITVIGQGFKLASLWLDTDHNSEGSQVVSGENAKIAPLEENLDLIEKNTGDISSQDRNFFVEYRMERDRVRSQQIELLKDIVQNQNSVQETRQEAQAVLLEITKRMEKELQLENLIAAKGYEDAVLFIQPSGVTVIIKSEQLSQEDVTRIGDLVSRSTGHDLKDIVVIPKK